MVRVGIVAPSRRLTEEVSDRAGALLAFSGFPIELVIHPQSYLSHGHFAGPDEVRLGAFLDYANDPTIDAIWFARGGYGAARLLPQLPGRLTDVALNKVYMGYSDAGFLLAGLTQLGCKYCAHGPLVADVLRDNGEVTILRALGFLSRIDPSGIESDVTLESNNIAFNLTILQSLLATPWLAPKAKDYRGKTLWIEDVAEYTYATDRSMFQLANSAWFKGLAGVRIGRFSAVPENDVPFPITSEESVAHWCEAANVPVIGCADIGHDADNKIVPFGRLRDWRNAGLIP
jgi:muramoyltetrapeptide carboxypeptidase